MMLTLFTRGASQCPGNLIKNGSFELDSVGEGVTGMFWYSNSSPDIDNALDSFANIGVNTVWSDSIISSSNGGNWQNIGGIVTLVVGNTEIECLGQRVTLKESVPHILEFEFTAQNIFPSFPGNAFAAIDVFIDDSLIYTTKVDTTLFTWENVSVTFTPEKSVINIEFKVNLFNPLEPGKAKYVAIDGVCLKPVETGMFCDP